MLEEREAEPQAADAAWAKTCSRSGKAWVEGQHWVVRNLDSTARPSLKAEQGPLPVCRRLTPYPQDDPERCAFRARRPATRSGGGRLHLGTGDRKEGCRVTAFRMSQQNWGRT